MSQVHITIKDIARALGCSPSTVSKALRDSYEISISVKEKIRAYADEHNYRASPLAVSMKAKATRSIGVMISDLGNSFFAEVLDGIDSVADERGYNVLIAHSRDSVEREANDLKYLTARGVDGVLISVTDESADHEYLRFLHERGLPFVLFDRIAPGIQTHQIKIDHYKGAYDAATELIHRGAKQLCAIAAPATLASTKERVAGFIAACADGGVDVTDHSVIYTTRGGRSYEEVAALLQDRLTGVDGPDGIIAMGERLTVAAMRFCHEARIHIPGDIRMVGYSNQPVSAFFRPSIPMVVHPGVEIGRSAATLLLDMLKAKKPEDRFVQLIQSPKLCSDAL